MSSNSRRRRSSSVGPRMRSRKPIIRPPSSSRKNVIVSTVTSFTSAPKTPTVIVLQRARRRTQLDGSFAACSLSFLEMWYLSSYLRNVLFLRRSLT